MCYDINMISRRGLELLNRSQGITRSLVPLILLDVLFVAVHAFHVRYGTPGDGRWLISRDRGYPELYQYVKEATIVVVMVTLAVRYRGLLYGAWAVVFAYFLVDDSAEVHERLGDAVVESLSLDGVLAIDGRDLAQVMVSAAAGLVLLVLVVAAYRRDRSPARGLTGWLAVLVLGLAFFGVVTDVIDAIDVLGITEDGGEMVMMSLMLATVLHHRRSLAELPATTETAGEIHLPVE